MIHDTNLRLKESDNYTIQTLVNKIYKRFGYRQIKYKKIYIGKVSTVTKYVYKRLQFI